MAGESHPQDICIDLDASADRSSCGSKAQTKMNKTFDTTVAIQAMLAGLNRVSGYYHNHHHYHGEEKVRI